ncbi:hypothetical protein BSKO_06769 [Bryopsis sp. KO-2023]|nr:hypothetical protein BSKO_06769 [Bryopsis sp. KO-2023]
MASRDLHVYESFLSTMGMGLALSFVGPVTEELLRKAFHCTQKEHPILRMVIEETDDSKKTFVEKLDREMELEVSQQSELEVGKLLTGWLNQPRDHAKSQTYFKYCPPHGTRAEHLLLVVANHSGMDGPGMLHIFASFCGYLGELASGNEVVEPKSREFCDILGRAVLPEGLNKPQVPEDILDGPAVEKAEVVEGETPGIRHIHEKLSSETTAKLIQTSRSLGYTIQGAICAAMMMSAAKTVQESHPLPQKMACVAPANMRQRVNPPLEAEDNVCGSAGLWWWQTISSDQKLADVAATATKEVRKCLEQGFGFGFWKWLQEEFWMPKYTVMGTTLGVSPIKPQYGNLEVTDVLFGGASYGADPGENAAFMRHISTFRGQLGMAFAHTWPAISDTSARKIMQTEMKCMQILAGPDASTTTVGEFLRQSD